jgi:hypothetical protein
VTTKTAGTAAQKAYEAAMAANAEAVAKLGPAADRLTAAKQALADAQEEALKAITEKSADPVAGKERFQQARKAVSDREDDVDWAIFEIQAFEVAERQANDAEQVAHRAVIIEQCQAASRDYNDPASRENILLSLFKDTVAELIPIIADREELHLRLSNELGNPSPEERTQLGGLTLRPGRRPDYAKPTLMVPGQPIITLESQDLIDALTAGIDAAAAAQAGRARAQRVG